MREKSVPETSHSNKIAAQIHSGVRTREHDCRMAPITLHLHMCAPIARLTATGYGYVEDHTKK